MTVRVPFLSIMAVAWFACSGSQTPVPVVGAQSDISSLAGEWTGEYWSAETGRSGSILFNLTSGTDSASGDVVMSPQFAAGARAAQSPAAPVPPPNSQTLTINFVRVTGGQVSGSLAPYTDPSCNCPLHTTFIGRLKADTLEGTYASRHEQGSDAQQGHWRVVRKRP
jgi:hypothetical protein